jgi:hypothetical protein
MKLIIGMQDPFMYHFSLKENLCKSKLDGKSHWGCAFHEYQFGYP